jgi:uncharacterized protein YpmB
MRTTKLIVFIIAMAVLFAGSATVGMAMKHGQGGGHEMSMHHQHEMINHSLGMALQGSNLVMLGQMEMVPGLDKMTIDHGKKMLKNARTMMNDTMSGDAMMKMHSTGMSPADNPMMKYTHQLGEAVMKVMDLLGKHADMKGHSMEVHHQHVILNHALKMALEGSDMIMTGQMGMAPGVDSHSVTHGKNMMKEARALWNEVMSGDSMMTMHGKGMSPDKNKGMAFTHGLAEAQITVMDLLEKMPPAM